MWAPVQHLTVFPADEAFRCWTASFPSPWKTVEEVFTSSPHLWAPFTVTNLSITVLIVMLLLCICKTRVPERVLHYYDNWLLSPTAPCIHCMRSPVIQSYCEVLHKINNTSVWEACELNGKIILHLSYREIQLSHKWLHALSCWHYNSVLSGF